MISSFTPKTACPFCHNTTVKQVALLYEDVRYQHNPRFTPPIKQAEKHFLIVPITLGIIIETLTLIAIMVVCASNTFSFGQYLLSVIGICIPLVWSAVAFLRIVRNDGHSQAQQEWDEAMATWSHSYYCPTDDLVFDPTQLATTRETAPIPSLALPAKSQQVYTGVAVATHAA